MPLVNPTTTDNDLQELIDELEVEVTYADSWSNQPGEVLAGTVTALSERKSDYNDEMYTIVTVKQADGSELAWHAGSNPAKGALERAHANSGGGAVEIGDRIAIRNDGETQSTKSKNKYVKYTVRARRDPTLGLGSDV